MSDADVPSPRGRRERRTRPQRLIALNTLFAWARAEASAPPGTGARASGEHARSKPVADSRGDGR